MELGWCTEEVVVLYLTCKRYRSQECHVEDNRRQGVISRKRLEVLSWCRCKRKEVEKVVWPRETKVQQSNAQAGDLESIAKEGDSRKEVRRTFKMLRGIVEYQDGEDRHA